jgi:hypothetical protein
MQRFAAVLLSIFLFPFRLFIHVVSFAFLGLLIYSLLMHDFSAAQSLKPADEPVIAGYASLNVVPQNRIPFRSIGWYHASLGDTEATAEVSACGPTLPNQIAVSRDWLYSELPCGTKVRVSLEDIGSIGEFIVWDTMVESRYHEADVLLPVGTLPTWTTERAWLTVID